jgi:hypothetical protein
MRSQCLGALKAVMTVKALMPFQRLGSILKKAMLRPVAEWVKVDNMNN